MVSGFPLHLREQEAPNQITEPLRQCRQRLRRWCPQGAQIYLRLRWEKESANAELEEPNERTDEPPGGDVCTTLITIRYGDRQAGDTQYAFPDPLHIQRYLLCLQTASDDVRGAAIDAYHR